ncbi:MAG TPA: (2Fe-2S) ferredoxin domain-containing protein [Chitinispirillaceae bacterium]|nr:(2Fe-2S) ferredoxin domain-containing protein [Chitinispirillaceae bacterium]
MNDPERVITICMGSSCFSRGNGKNYEIIRDFLKEKSIEADVLVKGCRCGGKCMHGPNIWIDDKLYSDIDQGSLIDILKNEF